MGYHLDVYNFEMTFWHEVGHFFLRGEDLSLFVGNEELAADIFAYAMVIANWQNNKPLSILNEEMRDYFVKLIVK